MGRTNNQYAPYEYMKCIDEVNYSLSEQLAVTKRLGMQLINVSSGVSYYPAPDILLEEIARAVNHPSFCQQYDGPEGSPLGRQAIQCYEHLLSYYGVKLSYENILITQGASMAMHVLGLYFADKYPGGEILVPVPTFALAGSAMKSAGLCVREVFYTRDKRFMPTVLDYQVAQSERTRLLYLNIFNNPTGECYDRQELTEIVQWAKESGITIIVDKVSADLIPDANAPNILDIAYERELEVDP